MSEPTNDRKGALYAVAAYSAWGLVPIYWKALGPVPALEVVAHRVVWSLGFVLALAALKRSLPAARAALTTPKTLLTLCASTTFITANWALFIWAVQSGRLLQSSLGYYINPLVNVLLGVAVLGEGLSRTRRVAVALAAAGVVVQTFATGVLPWVSLLLAATFALYGLIRKQAPVDALTGLLAETALLSPFALAYVAYLESTGRGTLAHHAPSHALLLSASGVITAVPLLWFTSAARLLPLSTLGFFQYISPTCQFLLAALVYGEKVTPFHGVTFALIWSGLALFSLEPWLRRRAAPRPAPPPR